MKGLGGVSPDQDDASLDIRDGMFEEMFKYIKDKYDSIKKKDASYHWALICSIEIFMDIANSNDVLFFDEVQKVMDMYEDCIKCCQEDDEWLESWRDPDAIKTSLKERLCIYEKYKALIKADNEVRHSSPTIP